MQFAVLGSDVGSRGWTRVSEEKVDTYIGILCCINMASWRYDSMENGREDMTLCLTSIDLICTSAKAQCTSSADGRMLLSSLLQHYLRI